MKPVQRIKAKLVQSMTFVRRTHTPLSLVLDSFKLKRKSFVAQTRDGMKLHIAPNCGDSFTFYENLIRKDYLQHGVHLKPGNTVVDIGANIGAFTVLAASIVGPTGHVFSFEPGTSVYNRLLKNIEINRLKNVTPLHYAIGGENGKAKLDLGIKSAYASICPGADGRENTSVTETVIVRRLADVMAEQNMNNIDLLKIDCEGAEYGILDTLSPQFARKIKQISMEVHTIPGRTTSGLLIRLEQLGFETRHTYPLVAFRRQ